jgi:predicted Ser/Thr protein kinase
VSSARDSELSNTVDGGQPANSMSPAQQVQQGARLERVVTVRRTGTRLGIDINELNMIVKLDPGSHAQTDSNLREGDEVIAVDGEQLEGRRLADVIRPGAAAYLFTVLSEDSGAGTLQKKQGTWPLAKGDALKQADQRPKFDKDKAVLIKRLRKCSYGCVYLGKCDEQEVAVKVLLLQAGTAEALKREVKLLRECECVHVVAFIGAFLREHQMQSTLWIVREFCHGGSLLDVMGIMSRGYTEPCIAVTCNSVLRALDYMHVRLEAIHRSIKSANVLLTSKGQVKLADLGVVSQLYYHTMTRSGTTIGTPHWIAPEVLNCSGGETGYDTKVDLYETKLDIWSLGITAIECAEQKPPFSNTNSIHETMMKIVQGPPPVLAEETNASPSFQAFVAAALVKDPLRRPSAAGLLLHPFLQRASQGDLRSVVQIVLGKSPLNGTASI